MNQQTPAPDTYASAGLSILVVDDSPVMRGFIRRVLAISGLDIRAVMEAKDGWTALEMMTNHQVDLVLSDINMPGMNGEQMLRTIEADDTLKRIPVIVVSTDSSRHRMEKMLAYGARGYVQKPFQPEGLRSVIEQVLRENSQ